MALGKYGPATFTFRPADAEVYDSHGNHVTTYADSTGTVPAPPSISSHGQVYFWVEAGTYDLLLATAGDSGTVTQSIIVAPGGTDEPNPNAASGAEPITVAISSNAAEPDNTVVSMPAPLSSTVQVARVINHPIGTVPPGGGFFCEFNGPIDVQGYLDFYVYSADGSQILERTIVSDSLITAHPGGAPRFIDFDQANAQKGSDLSWDPVTKKIVTTAGGIFGAVLWAQYHLPS